MTNDMADHPGATLVNIRLAKPGDAATIARMSRRLIEYDLPWWCWTPKRVAKAIRSPDTIALLAFAETSLAGSAIMFFGDEHAHLNLLAVEARFQRRGIGREMMEWLDESCRVAGIVRISLEARATNTSALRFYEALGFAQRERVQDYYCGQEAAVRLSRALRRRGV